MSVYNFPNNYLRIKFGNDTVKLYMPIAKTDTLPSSLNLRNLGEHAITQYVGNGTPFSWIPGGDMPLYRVNDTIVDIYNGLKNVEFDSNFAPRYNYGVYDYRKMFQKCGLNLDSQFIAVVLEKMGMLTPPFDTSTHTLYGYLVNENGTVSNTQIRVACWWSSGGTVERVFNQSASLPFLPTESYYNNVYDLSVRVSLNSNNLGDTFGATPFLNKSKNQIRTLAFGVIETQNPTRQGYVFQDGYVSLVNAVYVPNTLTGWYIDTGIIGNANVLTATANIAKNFSITTGIPYEGNGNSGQTPTSGSYDGTTESVTEDTLPTDNVLSSGLLRAYLPEDAELTNLHSYLFSSSFVDNIIKALKCPFDTIIKLHSLPITLSGYADTIKLGNLDSSIACDRTTSRYVDINLGNMAIDGYYGLFNDYSAKYDLYLPYLNVVSLPADEVINSTISINYRVDILTGDFVCTVSSSKTNAKGYAYSAIIYSAGGNMASDIPISQSNSLGMIGALNSGLNTAISKPTDIGGSFQTGVAIGVGGSVSYGTKGSLSSNSGKLGKRYPYFRETIPNVVLPNDFSKLIGFRSEITDTISNFSGFCKFRDFELDFGTVEEQNEIRQILNGGIYVIKTPSISTTYDIVLLNNTSDDRTLGKSFTTVAEINGDFKDFVNLKNIDIDIDITGLSMGSINYMYIASLGRYYFVRQKTMLNNSICRFSLVCDLLESMASDILNVRAICERTESGYYTNPMLADSEVPVQVNNIIKYHNFSAGLDSNTNVLICI